MKPYNPFQNFRPNRYAMLSGTLGRLGDVASSLFPGVDFQNLDAKNDFIGGVSLRGQNKRWPGVSSDWLQQVNEAIADATSGWGNAITSPPTPTVAITDPLHQVAWTGQAFTAPADTSAADSFFSAFQDEANSWANGAGRVQSLVVKGHLLAQTGLDDQYYALMDHLKYRVDQFLEGYANLKQAMFNGSPEGLAAIKQAQLKVSIGAPVSQADSNARVKSILNAIASGQQLVPLAVQAAKNPSSLTASQASTAAAETAYYKSQYDAQQQASIAMSAQGSTAALEGRSSAVLKWGGLGLAAAVGLGLIVAGLRKKR